MNNLVRFSLFSTLHQLATPHPWSHGFQSRVQPFQENIGGISAFQRDFSELERSVNSRILEENKYGIQKFQNYFKNAAYRAGALRTDFSRRIPGGGGGTHRNRYQAVKNERPESVYTSHQYDKNGDSFSFTIIENKSNQDTPSHSYSYFSSNSNSPEEIEVEQVLPNDRPFVASERDPLAQDVPDTTDIALVQDTPELAVDVELSPVEITTISNSEVVESDTIAFNEDVLEPVDLPPVFEQETDRVTPMEIEEPEVVTMNEADIDNNVEDETLIIDNLSPNDPEGIMDTTEMSIVEIMQGLDMLEEINTTRSDSVQRMISTLREMLNEEDVIDQ